MKTSVREKIAAVQHAIWSHWMRYLFSLCKEYPDGSMMIPAEKSLRWQRQMNTSYEDLSKKEQRSDLEQADKVLSFVSLMDLITEIVLQTK